MQTKGLLLLAKTWVMKVGPQLLEKVPDWNSVSAHAPTDSIEIEVRLLPNHPVTDDGRLRFSVALDNCAPQVVSYHTKGRSEEWKENVLGNQAIKKIVLPISSKKKHKINIQALDEGVILDQILLYSISNL